MESRGFSRPKEEGASLARFVSGDVLIDVATTPHVSVGYNRWYEGAFRARVRSPGGWWVPPPIHFLAMKFEAYNDPRRRGHGDPMASIDIEDVFVVLRGVRGVFDELATDGSLVSVFVRAELLKLAQRSDSLDVVRSNLEPDDAAQATAPYWLDTIRQLERGPDTRQPDALTASVRSRRTRKRRRT